ncbi:TIGR02680 family protein [Nocardia sp. NPDC004860]|uniref:TIGR02680 family protein n=1 Tax=Nocardia sp. NPDC004860 TaxID=3154557 RepID=UPI0033A6AD3C
MSDTPRRHFDQRWRLSRAGVVNVWHYLDTEFAISGGRLILRGANGSGKSRALEMLLPFLLDADRRRMDATGAQKVSLDELMHTGARGQTNRIGYLWLELACPDEYLTIGAHIKYSVSARRSEVRFFTTALRVGHELRLIGETREPLSRDALSELIGAHRLGDAEQHREAVRTKVFGLRGDLGRDRFAGLVQLLHTLRSPDVGNRIDEGKLPQILSDALPPLSEQTLEQAGERLDGLTETRLAQERLTTAFEHVRRFHSAYRGYATTVLTETATGLGDTATGLLTARSTHRDLADLARGLQEQRTETEGEEKELRDTVGELETAIANLQLNPLFKQADDLAQRDKAVAALHTTAMESLRGAREAREAEREAARSAAGQFSELRTAARTSGSMLADALDALAAVNLPHGDLPAGIGYTDHAAPVVVEPVMDSLDQASVPVQRPAVDPVTVYPSDLGPVSDAALRCGEAAEHRHEQATRRRQEANRLNDEHGRVQRLESDAEQAVRSAERDRQDADNAETERDGLAVTLNQSWREWVSSPSTARVLPGSDWSSAALAALSSDNEALCGPEPEDDDLLARLDELPELTARPIREALAVQANLLDQESTTDSGEREKLIAERTDLEAAHDPSPPRSPWHRAQSGIPFWQTVDFQPELGAAERAGLEAALLAAGLLTATIRTDGSLQAADGEILVRPVGGPVRSPLSAALQPDAADIADGLIESLLSRIGWNDPQALTNVDSDGCWRNGPLAGRHRQASARHIGATARAAARTARLAEIAARIDELDDAERNRDLLRTELRDRGAAIDAHLRTAPRSRTLLTARNTARLAADRASRTENEARAARQTAALARTAWSGEFENHRTLCSGMGLPVEADELLRIENACTAAQSACRRLAESCATTSIAVEKAKLLHDALENSRVRRRRHESAAEQHRRTWYEDAAGVAALHDSLDLPVEELNREIEESSAQHKLEKKRLDSLRDALRTLDKEVTKAESKRDSAHVEVGQRVEDLRAASAAFNARLRLPGLVTAATEARLALIEHDADAEHTQQIARAVLARLGASKPFTVNQLLNALTRFGADTSGQLDVSQRVEHGVHLVHIEGADHHHDCASVLSYLERRVEQGRQALTRREHEVFTGFVLGTVTEELRRRIRQAEELVEAMNGSLAGIRTSYGIGVSIAWTLDRQDPELHRLLDLVRIADPVRSEQDNDELVALVRDRVERQHAADASAGYATHLRAALDYRAWHDIEVTILGPEPNQRRRISRRAKISQGETRFVSYVTLFAAADSFLSGLPEAVTALRLVLLDDAFAKVDERAIGELMGLLVRLDIDFVMTGHALWGTVPEVPALDIYEIRRVGGSAVIPTRIHWDGKNRNYIHVVDPA